MRPMRPLRLVLLVLAALPTAACTASSTPANAPAGSAQASPSAEVAAVLDDFHDAAARADEDRYFGHLDSDPISGHRRQGAMGQGCVPSVRAPALREGQSWTFRAAHRDIVMGKSGDIAWFDESLATEKLGPARGSGVLVKRNGKWVILQYNLTLTIPNERFDVVKEATEEAKVIGSTETHPVASIRLARRGVGRRDAERQHRGDVAPRTGRLDDGLTPRDPRRTDDQVRDAPHRAERRRASLLGAATGRRASEPLEPIRRLAHRDVRRDRRSVAAKGHLPPRRRAALRAPRRRERYRPVQLYTLQKAVVRR